MKLVLTCVVLMMCHCSIFDPMNRFNVLGSITAMRASPNGTLVAVGNSFGKVEIYNSDGTFQTSRADHSFPIVGIQWLENSDGPVTISAAGRIAFWNGIFGIPYYLETGFSVINTAAWKTSFSSLLALNDGKNIYEYNVGLRVRIGTYNGFLNTNYRSIAYTEGGDYLAISTQVSSFTQIDFYNTIGRYSSSSYSYSLDKLEGSLDDQRLIGIDTSKRAVYQLNRFYGYKSSFSIDSNAESVTYCSSPYFAVGGYNFIEINNYNSGDSVSQNIGVSSTIRYLDCNGDFLYASSSNGDLYIAKRSPLAELPVWAIILICVVVVLIVVAAIIVGIKKRKAMRAGQAANNYNRMDANQGFNPNHQNQGFNNNPYEAKNQGFNNNQGFNQGYNNN